MSYTLWRWVTTRFEKEFHRLGNCSRTSPVTENLMSGRAHILGRVGRHEGQSDLWERVCISRGIADVANLVQSDGEVAADLAQRLPLVLRPTVHPLHLESFRDDLDPRRILTRHEDDVKPLPTRQKQRVDIAIPQGLILTAGLVQCDPAIGQHAVDIQREDCDHSPTRRSFFITGTSLSYRRFTPSPRATSVALMALMSLAMPCGSTDAA